MSKIVIIDYGMGNLYSVAKAVEYVVQAKDQIQITSNPNDILASDKVIFPGQGAARDCMAALKNHELESAILEAAQQKPFLGICMGMQVLMQTSDENGGTNCLGMYAGNVEYFSKHIGLTIDEKNYKVPHMGWNTIEQEKHPLWQGISQASYFYFVHSYFVKCDDQNLAVGTTDYGVKFTSVIAKDNVFAMQCHPEKSAQSGLQLLSNFAQWDGSSTLS